MMPLLKHTEMSPPDSWTPTKKSSVSCDSVPCCFHNPPPSNWTANEPESSWALSNSFSNSSQFLRAKKRPNHSSYLPLANGHVNHFIASGHSRSAGAEAAPRKPSSKGDAMPLREWVVEAPAGLTGILGIPNPHLSGTSSGRTCGQIDSPPSVGIRVNMDILLPTKNHLTPPTPQPPLFRDDHHRCSFVRPYLHEIWLKRPTVVLLNKQPQNCGVFHWNGHQKHPNSLAWTKRRFHLKTVQFIQ